MTSQLHQRATNQNGIRASPVVQLAGKRATTQGALQHPWIAEYYRREAAPAAAAAAPSSSTATATATELADDGAQCPHLEDTIQRTSDRETLPPHLSPTSPG